jgi:hypothetical protein
MRAFEVAEFLQGLKPFWGGSMSDLKFRPAKEKNADLNVRVRAARINLAGAYVGTD